MRRLARDVLTMAVATGISRLLGLLRDVAIADRFGASGAYDAFLIAFFIPHFLRQLLAEGALSTAFVPLYTRFAIAGDDADRFASAVLSWLVVLFVFVVGLGVWLAPVYVPFLASGFEAEKLALAVRLTRIVFPFIALVGFAAIFMGILNSHRRFFAASLAPVWFNLGMILGIVVLSRSFPGEPILGAASGVLIGGAAQLLAQLPSLFRVGFRFRWRLWPIHPEISRLAWLMAPAVLTLAIAEVNLLVDNKLASYLGDGGISSLQYAMRLFQLPLGVFAVSVATALLPRLSEAWARNEQARFSSYVGEGVALSGLVLLPATVGLFVVGVDTVRLLFEHGSFTPADSLRTARVLSFYLIGLFPYGLVYVFSRAFYALKRTRPLLLAAGITVAVNVLLDLALVRSMGAAGLAFATAISGAANALLLGAFLIRRIRLPWKPLALVLVGSGLLYVLTWAVRRAVGDGPIALAVFAPLVAGVGFYAAYTRWTPLWRLIIGLATDRADPS